MLGVALVVNFATVRLSLTGRFYGLYLLTTGSWRPLEIKDDLKLGDGPRLVAGVSFSWLRDRLAKNEARGPRLEVDWDDKEGGGIVTNYLAGGEVLQTVFGRYVDSDGKTPHGLFVGGAIADVSAGREQNQSGMAFHDARGWKHIWCSVNEGMALEGREALVFPGDWEFKGSRVLVDAPGRVVLGSEHEVTVGGAQLRMERYAYFMAGLGWFRLGINVMNVGDRPVKIGYTYGDEPWVGEFGSSAGNYGWTPRGVVTSTAFVDPRESQWGGILDTKTGVANFIGWIGSAPDNVYFGNHAGTPLAKEIGDPLNSNEVFIGIEWYERRLDPGETLSIRLTIGLAAAGPNGLPTFPPGAITVR